VLEGQLIAAAARNATATEEPTTVRDRRPRLTVALAATAVLLAGGAAAAAVSLVGSSDQPLPPRAERPQADVASPSMRTGFSITDRPRGSEDAMPSTARGVVTKEPGDPNYDGANASLSRLSGTHVRNTRFWVVPGNDTICVAAAAGPAGGGGCASTRTALSGGAHWEVGGDAYGISDDEMVYFGLAPDPVRAVTVETRTGDLEVPVVDNVWAVATPQRDISAVTVGTNRIDLEPLPPLPAHPPTP
jgi:hypothetical protein